MTTDLDRARDFVGAYAAIYHRFHRRVSSETYRPSREALAVMRHLHDTGPLTISEAGRHFDRSQAAMSEIISRLETRGVLERMPDTRDRRRHLVWLSPRGLSLLERESQVLSLELVEHAFHQMSAENRQQLMTGLDGLLRTLPSPVANPNLAQIHEPEREREQEKHDE